MNANTCPKCGNPVMPYKRFLREAEPYKVSACGSCNAMLKRSKFVYVYLVAMCAVMAAIGVPIILWSLKAGISFWLILPVAILWLGGWIFLINYLAWRYIGWVAVED